MTNVELESCICNLYAQIDEIRSRLENIEATGERLSVGFAEQSFNVDYYFNEALEKIAHRLIDYMRYQDIEAMDEEEFVRELSALIKTTM